MKIAHIAPLFETIPPRKYGGTERAISVLTQELAYMGHDVTVFATADSTVHGELVACRDAPLIAGTGDSSEAADHILEFDEVRRRLDDFDVIHFHTRFSHFPMFEDVAARTVTTCHNRVDFPELKRFYDRFRAFPLVPISEAQKRTCPDANWTEVIHHGYALDSFPAYDWVDGASGYLAFLGRACAEKGLLDAIRIARRTGRQLRIGARINETDRPFWTAQVEKEIDGDQIRYVGEIGEGEKAAFLNGASALLFPIQWPEPFGLVMIEAMACGTPVIAYDTGSVPEVVDDGVSGFVVTDVESAAQAVGRLGELDRAEVRACFETRFSAPEMARRHVELYRQIARQASGGRRTAAPGYWNHATPRPGATPPGGLPLGRKVPEATTSTRIPGPSPTRKPPGEPLQATAPKTSGPSA